MKPRSSSSKAKARTSKAVAQAPKSSEGPRSAKKPPGEEAGRDQFDSTVKGTTALQKAVRLIRALVSVENPSQLSDLAEAVAMPRPSVHRLLQQLEEVGVVQRDLSGRGYTVGPSWLWLAVDALSVVARRPPTRDVMRELVDQLGESCNLSILVEHEILYLARVECDWPLRMQLRAGSRVPIHCTASGKLLLAEMSTAQRQKLLRSLKLPRFTANTLTDPAQLEAECATIRARGISINREEYHLGLIGVAVPVKRSDGKVIAALAIHAPIFRMNVEGAELNVPLLTAAAARIGRELSPSAD